MLRKPMRGIEMKAKMWQFVLAGITVVSVGCGGPEFGEEVPAFEPETEIAQTEKGLFSTCRNTRIRVCNQRSRNGRTPSIKVLSADYYSKSEGRWYSEGLSDKVIAYGNCYTWTGQNLEHVENDLITKWKPFYRYREADGDWSDRVYQVVNTTDKRCSANDLFVINIQ